MKQSAKLNNNTKLVKAKKIYTKAMRSKTSVNLNLSQN